MGFSVTSWMIFTILAIFGLMIIDFLIAFTKLFWEGRFKLIFLDYLKDILYYILPLNVIVSMTSLDPTGWILVTLFFVGGISVALKYIIDIKRKLINEKEKN